MQTIDFHSNGKLLLTGEYLVLFGAKALAFPLKPGQSLHINPIHSEIISWETREKNIPVFRAEFQADNFKVLTTNSSEKANFIATILKACKALNPNFLAKHRAFNAIANVEFNMQWGLGSSSTLINNLAQFAKIDPMLLHQAVSKGSGYDVACASQQSPIIFNKMRNTYSIEKVQFAPAFINQLHLVYLNKKMATENHVKQFLKNYQPRIQHIEELNEITKAMLTCQSLDVFIQLLQDHENLISACIKTPTVKEKLFPTFEGAIKSLGAWGGDFVLTASHWDSQKQLAYFNNKGFRTVIPFKTMIL